MIAANEPQKNIYQRMAEVQKLVQTIYKNETVKMYETDKGYKAVTHDDVAAALHLPLANCGVFMMPEVTEYKTDSFDKQNQYGKIVTWYRTDLKIKVKWINIDKPEDFIECSGGAFALDTSDKSYAKAFSLALKIILLKVHLLESRDGEETRPFDEANGGEKFGKDQNQGNRNQNQNQNNRGNQNQQQNKNNQAAAGSKAQDKPNANKEPAAAVVKISDDQNDKIAGLMVRHSLEGADVEYLLKTGFNIQNAADTTAPQAEYIIKFLDVELLTSEAVKRHADELKVKRESRTSIQPDPADYIMDDRILGEGSAFLGKKLRQIDEKSLKAFVGATDADLATGPGIANYRLIFEANFKVKSFLKSMGV